MQISSARYGRPVVFTLLSLSIVILVTAIMGSNIARRHNAEMIDSPVERVSMVRAMKVKVPNAQAASPSRTPQIAREGKVTLYVANVDRAVTALTALTHRQDGEIFALQLQNADGASEKPSADMSVRVPAEKFDETMASLGRIGTIRDRSVTAEDLTGDLSDSSARLRNLRRTEDDIRKIMDRSGTVGQVLEAENQLSRVREQIETLESSLKVMRGRVTYSAIEISAQAEAVPATVEPALGSQLSTAFAAAVHALGQTTAALLSVVVWLAVFTPYAVVVGILWYVVRRYARKSRFAGSGQ